MELATLDVATGRVVENEHRKNWRFLCVFRADLVLRSGTSRRSPVASVAVQLALSWGGFFVSLKSVAVVSILLFVSGNSSRAESPTSRRWNIENERNGRWVKSATFDTRQEAQ